MQESHRPQPPNSRARVWGVVVDEQGEAISGIQLALTPGTHISTTDDSGSFLFEGVHAGEYLLESKQGDHVVAQEVRVTGDHGPFVLRLFGARVNVHVYAEHEPVTGAVVSLRRRASSQALRSTLTDTSGMAILRGLPPASFVVRVSAPGFAPAIDSATFTNADPLGTSELFVRLKRGVPLRGYVRDLQGHGVSNVTVTVWDAGSFTTWVGECITDERGEWRFEAVSSGTYELQASGSHFVGVTPIRVDFDVGRPHEPIIITVEPSLTLLGIVVDPAERAVADAVIEASLDDQIVTTSMSDHDGRFELTGLQRGAHRIRARRGLDAVTTIMDIGSTTEDVVLRLQNGSLEGVVIGPTGDPVPGIYVAVESTSSVGTGLHRQTADERGQFVFAGLEPGQYRITPYWDDDIVFRSDSTQPDDGVLAATGDSQVTVPAPRRGSVVGRVLVDGSPATHYGVMLSGHLGAPAARLVPVAVRSAEGRFRLEHVQPGSWEVTIMGHGTAKSIVHVMVKADTVTDTGDIVLAPGQRMSGHVRTSDGVAVAGACVTIGTNPGRELTTLQGWFFGTYQTVSDVNGRFAFDGVSLDVNSTMQPSIVARHPKYGVSRVRSVGDNDTVVDLILLPVGHLEALLDGFEGITWVELRHADEPEHMHEVMLSNVTRFFVEDLAIGDYAVILPSHLPWSPTRVTIRAHERSRVVIRPSK